MSKDIGNSLSTVVSINFFETIKEAVINNVMFIDQNNGNRETQLAGCFEFMNKDGNILICPIYKPEYGVVDQIISAIKIIEDGSFIISNDALGKMYFNFDDFENYKNEFNSDPENNYFYNNEQIGDFHTVPQIMNIDWNMENIPIHAQWEIHGRQKTSVSI
jgi:hypothetical protein